MSEEESKPKKKQGRPIARVADANKKSGKTRVKNRLAKGIRKKPKYRKKKQSTTVNAIRKRARKKAAAKNGGAAYINMSDLPKDSLKKFNHGDHPMNALRGDLIVNDGEEKFNVDRRNQYLRVLMETGSKKKAQNAASVTNYTICKYIAKHPQFRQYVSDILDYKIDDLEDAMFERATYGTKEQVFYQGEPVMVWDKKQNKSVPVFKTMFPESTAQFLMKGGRPDKYNTERAQLEVTGANGGPMKMIHTPEAALTMFQKLKQAKESMEEIETIDQEVK